LKRALTLVAIFFGLAIAPTASQAAVTKIPVTVALTGLDDEGGIEGQVTSAKAKCVRNLEVFASAPQRLISVTSDDQGFFKYGIDALTYLDFQSFESYVRKGPKFGKKGRRKRCSGDSANAELGGYPPFVNVEEFAFDDATNTFFGDLQSENPDCLGNVPMGLYVYDAKTGEYDLDRNFASGGTSFSVPYGSQPATGQWAAFVQETFIGASSFEDGDASVTHCQSGNNIAIFTP